LNYESASGITHSVDCWLLGSILKLSLRKLTPGKKRMMKLTIKVDGEIQREMFIKEHKLTIIEVAA